MIQFDSPLYNVRTLLVQLAEFDEHDVTAAGDPLTSFLVLFGIKRTQTYGMEIYTYNLLRYIYCSI